MLGAPLCALHKNHFRWRSLAFSAGLIASFLPVMVMLALLILGFEKADFERRLMMIRLLGVGGLWFVGFGGVLVWSWAGAIRLKGIKSDRVILVNVAPEFAEALRVHRQELIKSRQLPTVMITGPGGFEIPADSENVAEIPLINFGSDGTDTCRVEHQINQQSAATHFVGVQHLEQLICQAGPLADEARHVLEVAADFARFFHHDYVGTDHLLLGMRKADGSRAGQVLKNCQLPAKLAEIEVQNITAPRVESPSRLPVTPQLRKVMQNAWEEARARGHSRLEIAHILLGLVRQEEGIGTQILKTFGVDLEHVRKEALRYLLQMDVAFISASELEPRTASDQAIAEKPRQ